jgi:hypothetical protein
MPDVPSSVEVREPTTIWQLTVASLRANVVPGLILWVFGLAIVIGYYYWPAFAEALGAVGRVKQRYGLWYSIPALALFAGLVPFAFQRLQRDREKNFSPAYLLFLLIFWGVKGAEVDLLYRAQAAMFGDNPEPITLVRKVLVDQFVYVPIWAVPSMAFGYLWANRGFRASALRDGFQGRWYRRIVVPILIPNWLVWIPAVTLIYLLPEALQFVVQNLVACLFSCMLLFLSRHEQQIGEPGAS